MCSFLHFLMMQVNFVNKYLQAYFFAVIHSISNQTGSKQLCPINFVISFLYVCMVNTIYLFSFVETPRKFIIAELSIRKLGSSSVLIILTIISTVLSIISTDEDPSLRIESSAIIDLRGVSTKLNK